jgi:predicted transcriptional regulator
MIIYVRDTFGCSVAIVRLLSVVITAGQIRAARALIGWKQIDLAKASGVSEISIKNIERGVTDPRSSTLSAIQAAFEKAGVLFLEPGDIRELDLGED